MLSSENLRERSGFSLSLLTNLAYLRVTERKVIMKINQGIAYRKRDALRRLDPLRPEELGRCHRPLARKGGREVRRPLQVAESNKHVWYVS